MSLSYKWYTSISGFIFLEAILQFYWLVFWTKKLLLSVVLLTGNFVVDRKIMGLSFCPWRWICLPFSGSTVVVNFLLDTNNYFTLSSTRTKCRNTNFAPPFFLQYFMNSHTIPPRFHRWNSHKLWFLKKDVFSARYLLLHDDCIQELYCPNVSKTVCNNFYLYVLLLKLHTNANMAIHAVIMGSGVCRQANKSTFQCQRKAEN